MMILTKEATDKDKSLITQLLLSTNNSDEKLSGEAVWRSGGYVLDTRPELNLEKKDIPENCLFYINQSYISTVKNREIAMYHDNFILGQLIVAASQPAQIGTYSCKENEVKLHTCLYDLTTGEFKGLQKELAFIILRGDKHFENTILKLLMREERKRSFPLYFIICHQSLIEKKQLIYIKIMSI